MEEKQLLREINYQTKKANRNIQRLINISLIGILGNIEFRCKESENEQGRKVAKFGLGLTLVTEVLLLLGDVIDMKREKMEED